MIISSLVSVYERRLRSKISRFRIKVARSYPTYRPTQTVTWLEGNPLTEKVSRVEVFLANQAQRFEEAQGISSWPVVAFLETENMV